jgi:ACS family glucarate transporter-like MFS transporter
MLGDLERPSNMRYLVVAVTTAMAVLLYLDRVCISYAERFIQDDLKLSDAQIGWVVSAFFWTYALGQLPAGWLSDRFGARWTLSLYILSWSLFTALTGFAGGIVTLLLVRFGFGLAQAGAYPASAGLVSKWATFASRGSASSLVAFGGRVGGAIASPLTGKLILLFGAIGLSGWRTAMLIYGSVGMVVALVFWLLVRDQPSSHPWCNSKEAGLIEQSRPSQVPSPYGAVNRVPLIAFLSSGNIWLISICQWGTNVGWVFLVSWLPRYLEQVHGVPEERRGLLAGVPLFVGWFGMLAGGWATDRLALSLGLRWGRRFPIAASRFLAMGAFLVCLLPLPAWACTAAFAVVAIATDFGSPAMWAFNQDVGGSYAGSVLGWGNMWGNLGAAVSPPLLIWIVASTNSWNMAFVTCAAAFLLSGLVALGIDATVPVEVESQRHGEGSCAGTAPGRSGPSIPMAR